MHPGTNTSDLQQVAAFSVSPVHLSDLVQAVCLAPLMQLHSTARTCIYIFLCDESESYIPNTLAVFSHSKWPSLWQQLLNSNFRKTLSTNYERRHATAFCVKLWFDGPRWLQLLVAPGHPGHLATCGLAPSAQRGTGNSFLQLWLCLYLSLCWQ